MCMRTHTHRQAADTHMHTHKQAHTRTHARTHAHTHTHMHTHKQAHTMPTHNSRVQTTPLTCADHPTHVCRPPHSHVQTTPLTCADHPCVLRVFARSVAPTPQLTVINEVLCATAVNILQPNGHPCSRSKLTPHNCLGLARKSKLIAHNLQTEAMNDIVKAHCFVADN